MSFFSRFPDVGSGQRPGKPKIQTLAAINVWKTAKKRRWTVPTSERSQRKDIDRGQRQKAREPSQDPQESGINPPK